MYGIPVVLQTRADFESALEAANAGEIEKAKVASRFAGLIEASKVYVFDRILADGEAADGALPAYCVAEASEQDPVRRQLKLATDDQARIFQLGYTVEEVENIIKQLEGK